jgi:alkanesulfonate monooxygenase SsuD/methylene tetrahydromethanopterin reductase-like flavin-dependent oxidoreductase (luciferase family)
MEQGSKTVSEKPIEFACQLSPVERPGTSDFRLYDEAMSDARLGHALGYTTGWVIEHHFSDYYPVPNPLMFLSNVAAQCPGFGLGTSVMVLPWYNPIRLAEDISMLQLLTTGQVHIAMGRGTAKAEYDAFGIDMEEARERFHESWQVIQLALSGKPFTFDGKFTKLDAPIKLRPQLGDRKPKFYGAVSSPSSAVVMAEQGLPVMALLNYSNDVLGGIIKDWRAASSEPAAEQTFPLFTHCYIADTVEEARAQAKKYLPYYYEVQVNHYNSDNDVWKDMPSYKETGKMMSMLRHYTNPENLTGQLDVNLIGTPETITQRIKELADLGFNHLVIRNGTPGVPRDVRHGMMRRFAAEVMPHFRQAARKAA